MKCFRFLLFSIGAPLLVTACLEAPEFGDPPRLTGIDVYFKEIDGRSDSLVVRVDFEDGDGDLGVSGREDGARDYIPVPHPETNGFWIYNPSNPDFRLPPYECRLYDYIDLTPTDGIDDRDTIRANYNEAYYNYSITLYTKEDGQYEEYDFLTVEKGCTAPLGGRFPPLRDDLSVDRPLKGTIQWGSVGLYKVLFRNDTLRMDVTIRDQAGNVSNVITKEDFTLEDIDRSSGQDS